MKGEADVHGLGHNFGDELIRLDNQDAHSKDSNLNLDADLINSNEQPPQTTPLIAFDENNVTQKQDNLKGTCCV